MIAEYGMSKPKAHVIYLALLEQASVVNSSEYKLKSLRLYRYLMDSVLLV